MFFEKQVEFDQGFVFPDDLLWPFDLNNYFTAENGRGRGYAELL
jgi:hypothetical protein